MNHGPYRKRARQCSIEGCDGKGPLRHGMCSRHASRMRKYGEAGPAERIKNVPRTECMVEGCIGKGPFRHGLCRIHSQRMWKHGEMGPVERLRREHGIGSIVNGYVIIQKEGTNKGEHVRVAEKALGRELPSKSVVHHVDENPLNNDPSNLVICQNQGYHMLLHQRLNALKACGNVNWRPCWVCKTYDDPINLRKRGTSHLHPKCEARYYYELRNP